MQRSSRLEKRGFDGDDDCIQPETKRTKIPALASVVIEALKFDSLQKLCSSLEPVIRRVVSEEVERALAKLGPARLGGRSSPKRIEGPNGRKLKLQFKTKLSTPLFTGGKVEGEQGSVIHVVLMDVNSGHVVTTGLESSAKLDVVVLDGDFDNEDDHWTEEEFDSHVVKEREGKRPLLTGDLLITLNEGVGTLGELTFTDNSSWVRSRKFKLGLKVASGFCQGIRICEAKTEAFLVKDHRGELYKKHYPPALTDEVWRLEKIGKDGSFHKKLNESGINTVEDFLRIFVRNPQKLRKILGTGMSNKMWEILVEHAKTCILSGKYHIYYAEDMRNIGAIFNNIFEFSGLIVDDQFFSADLLNDSQKVFADSLVKKAYDNWIDVIEYDGVALLNCTKSKKATSLRNEMPSSSLASQNQQVAPVQLQTSSSLIQPSFNAHIVAREGTMSAIYNESQLTGFGNYPQNVASTSMQFEGSSRNNQFFYASNQIQAAGNVIASSGLASQLQESNGLHSLGQPLQQSNVNNYDDWSHQQETCRTDDYFSEEDIRLKSIEMLTNEDMQHLLRGFSMSGASVSYPDEGFGFSYIPSPCPNFNIHDDHSRSSGRAVVGWLKIKAAMRWGIFIRKKAAEKRAAQLIELED